MTRKWDTGRSIEWKISGNDGTSEKVVLFSRTECPNGSSCSSNYSQTSLIPVPDSVNGEDLYKW